jgi:hypothetical protein
MGEPARVRVVALLAIVLLAACEARSRPVTTESGDKLTTESGDQLRSYTARTAP